MEIYGTLGPSCSSRRILVRMMREGMTGIRLNLSHVSLMESEPVIREYQAAAGEAGIENPELLIDMQGPELRIGKLKRSVLLERGSEVILGAGGIPVPDVVLEEVPSDTDILLDDGRILLHAVSCGDGHITAKVERGGMLQSRKSMAVPDVPIHLPAVTESDVENLCHAREMGVTAVMQPFVRSRADLQELRRVMEKTGAGGLKVFAKIENMEGVRDLDELIPEADMIVIARGDLGNAVDLWDLPGIQKDIEKKCRESGRAFLVVTQMLASMEHKAVPTRAEVSDIFNAVIDGAAGVMITGESAVGEYPVEAIRYLAKTAESAEAWQKKHGLIPA